MTSENSVLGTQGIHILTETGDLSGCLRESVVGSTKVGDEAVQKQREAIHLGSKYAIFTVQLVKDRPCSNAAGAVDSKIVVEHIYKVMHRGITRYGSGCGVH